MAISSIKRAARFLMLTAALAGLSAVGMSQTAWAESTRIRIASQYAEGHPTTQLLRELKERIEKASDKRIRISLYPANQLGDYTQVYEELRRGTIDAALISVPSQFDSRLEVMYLPYLAMNYAEARSIYKTDSPLFRTAAPLHEGLNVKLLGFSAEGFGGLGLAKMPTNPRSPEGTKGILLRVPPMEVFRSPSEDQGFQTVSIPFAELYTALQTGVADGWSGGPAQLNYLQFGDVIKHFLVNNNFFEVTSYLMSEKRWKALSAEDQKLFADTVADLSKKSFDIAQADEAKYLKLMKERGINVVELSDEELKALANIARKVTWPKLEKRISKEILQQVAAGY